MSLFTGLTGSYKLGGIIGLSSYLVLGEQAKTISDELPGGPKNLDTPVFMGHGDSDPLVKPEWGKSTAEMLKAWGYKVDLKMYKYVNLLFTPCSTDIDRGLVHSAADEEIDDVEEFLKTVIPPEDEAASKA
jgi:dienelactone hydrolase